MSAAARGPEEDVDAGGDSSGASSGRRRGAAMDQPFCLRVGPALAPRQPRDVALVQQERVKYEEEHGARLTRMVEEKAVALS